MFRPDVMVDAVHQLTPAWLRQRGIRGVLVDLDDTLLPAAGELLEPRTVAWMASLRDAGIPVVILSNGERGRVAALAGRFGVPGLPLSGKPMAWAFRRALRLLGTPPGATAMVGDQLFTDVLGANLAGLTSVLVRPLSPGKLPHTRFARRLERMVLVRGGDRGGPVHR